MFSKLVNYISGIDTFLRSKRDNSTKKSDSALKEEIKHEEIAKKRDTVVKTEADDTWDGF